MQYRHLQIVQALQTISAVVILVVADQVVIFSWQSKNNH